MIDDEDFWDDPPKMKIRHRGVEIDIDFNIIPPKPPPPKTLLDEPFDFGFEE